MNQEILKASKKYSQQFESFSTNVPIAGKDLLTVFYRLFYLQFLRFKWSVIKHYLAKFLLLIWEITLHESNRNYNSYRFCYKFACILFLSILTNQKQESGFQQVCGLVMRNISVFCL